MTARATIGGNDRSRGPLRGIHNAPHPEIPGSILSSADAPLERSNFVQTMIDIAFVFAALLLVCSSAAAFGLSFYFLFFASF